MSQYATAIQDTSQEQNHFGPSGHDIRQPVRVHAVHWPDPGDARWAEARTMCGRSTAGMEKAVHTAPDLTAWHAPRWDRLKCAGCDEAVRAAAGG
ncbi:hypothetical protein SLUN_16890 [Streptomyces lunaelactis]|uniref:Uncharacterized protein n=1 Tax=Streptomyces lunaelactis TaxID=1535768 RepID=A0A2R4T372_9ACTN|nr:hypothetical protein [Streptomyces lunaelactis]AVZ73600.1 hypothetical protein SLUN_16890 [Streptomyces lunaelactis]NUK85772.1 hypothetical protein [Streptomyces lunaelactis]NUL04375.1 hypothetical protein [Streptomyces lunaelactis]